MKKKFVLLMCFILAMGMVSCGDDKLDEVIDTEQGGDDGKDDGDDGKEPEPEKAVSWYVAPNGNDSSNGMIATPLKSVAKALQRANPGKVCIMSLLLLPSRVRAKKESLLKVTKMKLLRLTAQD